MTTGRGIEELNRLLRENHWREANDLTRCLLPEGRLDIDLAREIDACWSECSNGKFGFLEQRRTWVSLGGPPLLPGFALWDFFRIFGDVVGWRRGGRWISWAGVVEAPEWPTLEIADIPLRVPLGCLPFHDVMSTGLWRREFQPRDCWGEHVWDRWSDLLSVFA